MWSFNPVYQNESGRHLPVIETECGVIDVTNISQSIILCIVSSHNLSIKNEYKEGMEEGIKIARKCYEKDNDKKTK